VSRRLHVGVFEREEDLRQALVDCRQRGVPVVDAYSPYPLHGVDPLLGIRRSRLTVVCFLGGLTGLTLGLGFQYWTSAVNWPTDVGGKPFDSLPAFIPIAFEMTVLFGGLATALALCVRSRLWPGRRYSPAFEGVSDDRFALVVAEDDAALPSEKLTALLSGHGALHAWQEVEE